MKYKKFGSTESRIYDMVKPIADAEHLIVWDVRFEKEGACWYLRVFLDRAEGMVTIADCEAVTRPLNAMLDEKDPISQSYTLEVGSAGLERELIRETHFTACVNSPVRVRCIRPLESGERDLSGTLLSCDKDSITVQTATAMMTLPLSSVAFVRLADFDATEVLRAQKEEKTTE